MSICPCKPLGTQIVANSLSQTSATICSIICMPLVYLGMDTGQLAASIKININRKGISHNYPNSSINLMINNNLNLAPKRRSADEDRWV